MIGLINLDVKCVGARSAGNPHAACDEAGAGNGITVNPTRARRRKLRIQTRVHLVGYRASPRPYRDINKDIVRRILAKYYYPPPDNGGGPSWLTFIGHMKDSLWSVDLFRCESILLKTH